MTHSYPRPEHPCGAHIRSCLLTASPDVITRFLAMCEDAVRDPEVDEDLRDILAALAFDAMAAAYELGDQLDAMLDEEP